MYVVQVSSIVGRLPPVSVGVTGTIPFKMGKNSEDFHLPFAANHQVLVMDADGGVSS
jgi:hypothetical protein